MPTILCYGDSNTWGFNPATKGRYDRHTRWPGVMRAELGPDYWVVEEGLNGRTTVGTDPVAEYRNGIHLLQANLDSHAPLDLMILMLGTNDLKIKFSASVLDIAKGVAALIEIARRSVPRILLISPPPLGKLSEFAEMFERGTEKSTRLAAAYEKIALEAKCDFLDAGTVVRSSVLS